MSTYLLIHTGTVKQYLHDAARPWMLLRIDDYRGEQFTHCLGRYSSCKAAGAARRAAVKYDQDETGH